MKRRKRDEEPVNHVFTNPRGKGKPGNMQPAGGEDSKSPDAKSSTGTAMVVRHAKDAYLEVHDSGPHQEYELFLDSANVPYIKIMKARGRQTWPLDSEMARSYVVHRLFDEMGGLIPTKAEVDGMLAVLRSKAVMNGQLNGEADWKDNLLEQDSLTNALFTLAGHKAPMPWEATAAQILVAVDVLAAKEHLDKGDQWPMAPNRMSIELEKRQEVLKELGVTVTKLARTGTARRWRLEMSKRDGDDATTVTSSPKASQEASLLKSLDDNWLKQCSAADDALARRLEQIVNESGSVEKLTSDDILGWIPAKWDQFAGNTLAVSDVRLVVGSLLNGEPAHNILLIGPEDSGREAAVFLAARTLLCDAPDLNSLDPCGKCNHCIYKWGNDSVFEKFPNSEPFQFLSVDCSGLNKDNLAYETSKAQGSQGNLVVYLRRLDHLNKEAVPDLLTLMDDKRYVFFAKASGTAGIIPEILEQFEVANTSDPTTEELATFLAERCRDWGITIESGYSLIRLAHISGQRVGTALEAVAEAADSPERRLTPSIVERCFDEA